MFFFIFVCEFILISCGINLKLVCFIEYILNCFYNCIMIVEVMENIMGNICIYFLRWR